MDYDNPAARLLAILEEGKKLPNQGCRAAWDILLKTDGETSLLMSRLGTLYGLPALILKSLQESFPAYVQKSAHWRTQVNKGFMSQNLQSDWTSFINHIDDHTINYLTLTAEILQSKATTKSIADDEILGVREQLDDIYKEVLAANNLPIEIKTYLAHYLSKILNSIDEYFLTGAFPLLETTSALLGHAFLDDKYRNFLRDEELGGKIFECLTAMANVVTVAVGLPQLTQALALLK